MIQEAETIRIEKTPLKYECELVRRISTILALKSYNNQQLKRIACTCYNELKGTKSLVEPRADEFKYTPCFIDENNERWLSKIDYIFNPENHPDYLKFDPNAEKLSILISQIKETGTQTQIETYTNTRNNLKKIKKTLEILAKQLETNLPNRNPLIHTEYCN